MKKKLVLISSFIVFLIQTVSMLIVGTISTILIHSGIITIKGSSKTRVIMVICCILGASILIGFIVSIIFTRIPVKPLDELIKGMDRLADGDYSVRIKFNKNPGLKKVEHSFNKMAEELQNTELLSNNFINDFSHEFKTPLVSILGFTKLLRKNILTDEEREEYLGIIEEEMKRLYTMANGILNLTKVENQSILTNVTEYNLSEQIRLTVLLLESKWTARNINMNIDFGEYTINANEEMMKQVDAQKIGSLYRDMQKCIEDIKLPKFTTSTEVVLNDAVSKLGAPSIFNGAANFKNMSDANIFISKMLQKAKIEVSEEGTKAAAITAGMVAMTALDPNEPRHVKFHANRPFVYIITEKQTGAIFFIGQYLGE